MINFKIGTSKWCKKKKAKLEKDERKQCKNQDFKIVKTRWMMEVKQNFKCESWLFVMNPPLYMIDFKIETLKDEIKQKQNLKKIETLKIKISRLLKLDGSKKLMWVLSNGVKS